MRRAAILGVTALLAGATALGAISLLPGKFQRAAARLGIADASVAANLGAPPPTTIGINLIAFTASRQARSYANLLIGGGLRLVPPAGRWQPMPPELLDSDGELRTLPAGNRAAIGLSLPNTGSKEQIFRCTYVGKGTLTFKRGRLIENRPNLLRFGWQVDWEKPVTPEIMIIATDVRDPIRRMDCREESMDRAARFDPAFIGSLRGFTIVRFMDWQRSNDNAPATWATRNTMQTRNLLSGDGVPVEDMVEIVRLTGADPWFIMPWNASNDYVESFARYIHDNLPAGRRAYVECANEVWNKRFSVSRQAAKEGLERGLAPDANTATMLRYAERLSEVMAIWSRIFADRPAALVRVAATQNGVPWRAQVVLEKAATSVDALATAPYFNAGNLNGGNVTDPAEIERMLAEDVDKTIDLAQENRAIAAKFGKRYIAYEGGQHIVLPRNVPLLRTIQHAPYMYVLYRRYIGAWRQKVGDALTLYANASPPYTFGAWGLSDYIGQSVNDAPKLRAVRDELAVSGKK